MGFVDTRVNNEQHTQFTQHKKIKPTIILIPRYIRSAKVSETATPTSPIFIAQIARKQFMSPLKKKLQLPMKIDFGYSTKEKKVILPQKPMTLPISTKLDFGHRTGTDNRGLSKYLVHACFLAEELSWQGNSRGLARHYRSVRFLALVPVR